MTKITLLLLMILSISTVVFGQISEGGEPYSFHAPDMVKAQLNGIVTEVKIDAPDLTPVFAEDQENDSKSIPYRVGLNLSAQISPQSHGTWTNIPSFGEFWQCKIKSEEAMALGLYFEDAVDIPEGGRLYVYNKNKKQVLGAYTHKTDGFEAMEMLAGDEMYLEYFAPHGTVGQPKINIKEVVYFYRSVEDHIASYTDGFVENRGLRADPCQVDVACTPESNGWQDQINSVVHYTFPFNGTSICSASTINNTAQDCTPYILSAWHCGEPAAGANLSGNVWYWNYQKSSCQPNNNGSNPSKGSETMTGGVVRASSENGTLNNPSSTPEVSGSDFFLLELNSNIPTSYNAFFAGWDRTNAAATSGVSIHHPSGSAKKISTFTSTLVSTSWNGGAANAHWRVNWSETTNGRHGVTEGGSSGSPIFNQNGHIVGQLTGGASFCTSPNDPDWYGKMYTNWNLNGSTNNSQLQPWLDPTGSGVNSLSGTYNPCTPVAPTANFNADQTTVNTGTTVNFTDLSSGSPTSWSWSISPGSGWTYATGNANSQDPQVTFNTSGSYTVTLIASNAQGSDTETKTNYITVNTGSGGCINVNSTAYSMGFEQNEDLSDWAIYNLNGDQDANGNNITWGVTEETTFSSNSIPMTANSGTRLAYYFYTSTQSANDWIMTPCFQLEPGYDYSLTFWHRVASSNFPEQLKVEIGGAQNPSSMSTTLLDLGSVDNENYVQSTVTFTVASAGNYYIGFHAYSNADQYVLGLDDINLSAQANGTATNIEVSESWDNQVNIYPNPAKTLFYVELLNDQVTVENVELYSVSGQLISSQTGNDQTQFTFNLQDKAEGIYIVKIITNKGTSIKKVTKY